VLRYWAIALVLPPLLTLVLFGGVHTAVWAALVAAAGAVLLASVREQLAAGGPTVHPRHLRWLAIPYLLALALVALQLWPAPPAGLAHPLWASAGQALATAVTPRVSLAPADTLDALMRLAAYGALFWVAVQAGRSRYVARAVLRWVAAGCTAFAVYGLVVYLGGLGTVLWLEGTPGEVTGTLVNRNNAATVLGTGWLTVTALLLGELRERLGGAETAGERRRVVAGYLLGSGLWLTGAWLTLLSALLLTHSRAGVVTSLLGLIVVVLLLLSRRVFGALVRRTVVALIALGLLATLALSGGVTLDRLAGTELETEQRFDAYAVVLDAAGDAPWIGTGLGTFREVFRFYQPADLPGQWGMAHSTYLELLLTGGWPLALLLVLPGVVAIGTCLVSAPMRRRDGHIPTLAGAVGLQVGLHSAVDFSLQIPAIAAMTAVLLGVGVAQAWSSRAELSR